jgi:putative transposase
MPKRNLKKNSRKRYPTYHSNGAWKAIKPRLPLSPVGRPRALSLRQILNAIFDVLKTGCQWRQ